MTHANAVEVVWTALALVGLGASLLGFLDAWIDGHRLKGVKISQRARIVARMNLRNEAIRLFVLTAFVMIGIAAMAIPNNPDAFEGSRLLVAAGFITVSVLIVFGTYADRRDRRLLLSDG